MPRLAGLLLLASAFPPSARASLAAAPAKADGPGPYLAPAWTADLRLTGQAMFGGTKGTYLHDSVNRRNRQSFDFNFHAFHPNDTAAYDILSIDEPGYNRNMTVGTGADAVCKPTQEGGYVDFMGGLQNARYVGHGEEEGEPCELWNLLSPDDEGNTTVCLGADGAPRRLDTNRNLLAGKFASAFAGRTIMHFSNIKMGLPGDDAFRVTAACATNFPTRPCTVGGGAAQEIVTIDVYRIRSRAEPNELSNRNTGDALGDMAFVCMKGAAEAFRQKVVTHWTLPANSSWGQYAYCLFEGGKNTCIGGTGNHVGRESAWGLGVGHLQGQCSPNEDVGSWFSFPTEGLCKEGEAIGTNGCTWGPAKAVRTVAARCIFEERGLTEACDQEREHAPYTRSSAILKAALASEDPSKGGCPSVVAEGLEEIVLV